MHRDFQNVLLIEQIYEKYVQRIEQFRVVISILENTTVAVVADFAITEVKASLIYDMTVAFLQPSLFSVISILETTVTEKSEIPIFLSIQLNEIIGIQKSHLCIPFTKMA